MMRYLGKFRKTGHIEIGDHRAIKFENDEGVDFYDLIRPEPEPDPDVEVEENAEPVADAVEAMDAEGEAEVYLSIDKNGRHAVSTDLSMFSPSNHHLFALSPDDADKWSAKGLLQVVDGEISERIPDRWRDEALSDVQKRRDQRLSDLGGSVALPSDLLMWGVSLISLFGWDRFKALFPEDSLPDDIDAIWSRLTGFMTKTATKRGESLDEYSRSIFMALLRNASHLAQSADEIQRTVSAIDNLPEGAEGFYRSKQIIADFDADE